MKSSLIILLLTSAFALVFAYVLQFVFGYQPCILCHYERVPFFVIIALTTIGLITNKFTKVLLFCCVVLLVINCGISLYHTAVEQKIFAGPSTCSAPSNLNEITDAEILKEELLKTKAVRCDQPQLSFLKLSLAAWNGVYCALLLFFLWCNRKMRTTKL